MPIVMIPVFFIWPCMALLGWALATLQALKADEQ